MIEPKSQHVSLNGTLDLVTPPISKKPGHAIIAENVHPTWGGGFSRIEGVEPIDGGATASEYSYYRLAISNDVSVDAAWIGRKLTLNAYTGVIVAVDIDNNALRVGSVSMSASAQVQANIEPNIDITVLYVAPFGYGENAEEQAKYLAETHKIIMDSIQPPLGDGLLRGVVKLDDYPLMAFRDDGDGCRVSIAKDDRSWEQAPIIHEVELASVTSPGSFLEGATVLIGSTSRVIIASIFSADGQTGRVFLDGSIVDVIGSNVTINGQLVAKTATVSKEVSLTGKRNWKFIYHNYYASSASRYAYGTNGVDVVEVRPNGVVVPIILDLTRNITDICEHKNHLFISFVGGQYGHCVVGEPLNWEILLGAETFGTGDEITALQSLIGNYLLIGCKNSIQLLSGTTRDNWQMSSLNKKIGVTTGTLTSTFIPIAHSKHGFINVEQTQAYGDFIASELSANELLGESALVKNLTQFFTLSHNQKHNQVRFYQIGNGHHVVIQLLKDGKTRATFFRYHKPVTDVWDTADETYLAFDDGRVYRQTTKVHSFNGEDIYWALRFAFTHCGSPTTLKTFNDLELHMSSEGSLTLKYSHTLDYGSPEVAQSLSSIGVAYGGGGRWNEAFWNDFYWSSPDYITPAVDLDGHGKNISILLSGKSNFEPNFKLDGYSISYIPRRRFRA